MKDAKTQYFESLATTCVNLPPEIFEVLNKLAGTNARNADELTDQLLSEPVRRLKHLCFYYERQADACFKAGAFLAAVIMGGACVEGFLLLLCCINSDEVQLANSFQKRAGRFNGGFEDKLFRLGLDDLGEIALELHWIDERKVETFWRDGLAQGFVEMAPLIDATLGPDEINRRAEALRQHPAVALLTLIQQFRNLVHAGRCVRNKQELHVATADDWFKLACAAFSEARNCLLLQFQKSLEPLIRKRVAAVTGIQV